MHAVWIKTFESWMFQLSIDYLIILIACLQCSELQSEVKLKKNMKSYYTLSKLANDTLAMYHNQSSKFTMAETNRNIKPNQVL